MIEKIEFDSAILLNNPHFKFLDKCEFFKENKEISFSSGVNVIISNNGTGKSTILQMIALSLAAEQGGVSKITSSWKNKILNKFSLVEEKNYLNGIKVHHDGQKINYFDSRKKRGILEDGDIDPDFNELGFAELLNSNYSSGEKTMFRTRKLFELVENFKEQSFDFGKEEKDENILKILSPSISLGKPTLLFDEPEVGLSPVHQFNFFDCLSNSEGFKKYQSIIVTHSPFVFLLPNVNVISLEGDTYISNNLSAYKKLMPNLEKYI